MLDNLCSLDNVKKNEVAEKISNNLEYLLDKVKELPLNEKVEEKKILKTFEVILEFNRQQQGKILKILTPNKMLNRLPISLAQLKVGNNSEKIKTKLGSCCILCTDKKKLQKNSVKVWLTLFKDENNFYKQRKQ